jgi:23S rRNA (uracil1939-C5)-methyltransferase
VYFSCNPSALAKDITVLDPEYRLELMQPVDKFPQTADVEVVTEFVLQKGN